MTEPVWRKNLTDWNEGLGVVYERFILNDYLDEIIDQHYTKNDYNKLFHQVDFLFDR